MPEPTFRTNLFRGTAADYDRYRPSYAAELGEWLAGRLALDGSGRLLDLGSGTGRVARLLRPYFGQVVAVDAEPDMVAYGQAHYADGIEWRLGRAEELELPDASFDVISAGDAFHRFDRPVVAAKAARWLTRGGAVALFWSHGPLQSTAAWQGALSAVVDEWIDHTRVPEGWERDDHPHEVVLDEAGFTILETHELHLAHTWTIDDILGFLRSTSIASSEAMGTRADAFEDAVRKALLAVDSSGAYEQQVSFAVNLARRP